MVLVKVNKLELYKLVVVTPIPTTDRPPKIVVETLVPPIVMPPMALAPVPIATVVVPDAPVAMLTVLEVPIPTFTVCAAVEFPKVIAPVPDERPIVNVPAAETGLMLGTARRVPVAFWKLRYVMVELVMLPVVIVALPKVARPEAYILVVETPIPTTDRPPKIVVETLVPPIVIPPMALAPVPIATVVVPEAPVAIFTVDDVPIPRLRVSAAVELPTVMAPVPAAKPMVRVPATEVGLIFGTARRVPVAFWKFR